MSFLFVLKDLSFSCKEENKVEQKTVTLIADENPVTQAVVKYLWTMYV